MALIPRFFLFSLSVPYRQTSHCFICFALLYMTSKRKREQIRKGKGEREREGGVRKAKQGREGRRRKQRNKKTTGLAMKPLDLAMYTKESGYCKSRVSYRDCECLY